MKLVKLVKYGLLAMGLLGNTIASEGDPKAIREDGSKIEKQQFSSLLFSQLPTDINVAIMDSYIPYEDWPSLFLTCKDWNKFIEEYRPSVPVRIYADININIHPTMHHYRTNNFACTSDSLYIFQPFQEGKPAHEVTCWEKTTGFCINGYTGQAQSLTPFDGIISWCASDFHPQGIVLQHQSQLPQLLKITDTVITSQPLFKETNEEMKELIGFSRFCCSPSHILFTHEHLPYLNLQELSCYPLNGGEKRTIKLPRNIDKLCNYGSQFLATGPNGLYVIDTSLETLEAKAINLPSELTKLSEDRRRGVRLDDRFNFNNPITDGNSVIIGASDDTLSDDYLSSPVFYTMLSDILTNQPKVTSPKFFPKDYNIIGLHWKKNYLFSIISKKEEEGAVKGTFDKKQFGFLVHNLTGQNKCFETFFPSQPVRTGFAGHTIFVTAITDAQQSLLLYSFNIQRFLSKKEAPLE